MHMLTKEFRALPDNFLSMLYYWNKIKLSVCLDNDVVLPLLCLGNVQRTKYGAPSYRVLTPGSSFLFDTGEREEENERKRERESKIELKPRILQVVGLEADSSFHLSRITYCNLGDSLLWIS